MSVKVNSELAERIREKTGENVYLCYQCAKCTSGCPLGEFFDMAPNQVLGAAQLGLEKELFDAKTPWLCASCQTCTTRCPQGVDLARIMDFIVSDAIQRGIKPKVPEVALFNKVFLRDVNLIGRSYELGLIAEVDLRNLTLVRDIPLGVAMIRKGQVAMLPEVVRPRWRAAGSTHAGRPQNEVGYYPGCSLHGVGQSYDRSAQACLKALGMTPVEPEGWVCCGSTPAHRLDADQAMRLPLMNLDLLDHQGFRDVALPCAACFNRFQVALHELRAEPDRREKFETEMGHVYSDRVGVHSLLGYMVEQLGLEKVRAQVKRPLAGLKVACYYGCLLTRPPRITGSGEAEYPRMMDQAMAAVGAQPVDWDLKTTCCGASLALTRTDIIVKLCQRILENARARGAEMIVVACPLCSTNLESRQDRMPRELGTPIVYFTQLMAVAFGLEAEAGLQHNMVDARPILRERVGQGERTA
ncbi:MAG: heterodisulfide reductase-related iron-sulfur binding cluster [Anaerolineales bacterium]|jgi:heterodisulfide reductase subunit B